MFLCAKVLKELVTCCAQPLYKLRHDMDLQASLSVGHAKKNYFSCRASETSMLSTMRDLDQRMGLNLPEDVAGLGVYSIRT